MSALCYLSRKQIKNFIKELAHNPGKLVLYIILIAGISVSVFSRFFSPEDEALNFVADISFLHGGYIGAMLLISLPILLRGLKSGATFFRMSDVHFLFIAPISPKLILFYGLIKQLMASALVTLILLAYSSMLTNLFGIEIWQIIVLAIGVAIMLCAMQALTMMIYSLTNGKKKLIQITLAIVFACVLALLAIYVIEFFANGADINSAISSLSSPYLEYVPMIGWMKGAVFGYLFGNYLAAGIYTALFIAVIGAAIAIFAVKDLDFYEDVLQSTARADQVRKNKREGKMDFGGGKVRVTSTGIKKGWGANVLFYKHMLEGKRRNRFFISTQAIFLFLINIIFVVIFRISAEGQVTPNLIIGISAMFSCYIQFFFSVSGDWSLELDKTPIYLIPANPFQKLIWASMTTIIRPFMEGIIMFAILCAVLQANPLLAFVCAIVYGTTGLLYTACNILFQKLFGKTNSNRGPIMFIYMLCVLLVATPGIISSILVWIFATGVPSFVIGLPFIGWTVGVSVLIICLCRNILDNVEYNK